MEPESVFLTLLRKEDFLLLTVQAVNMHLEGNPAILARTDPAQPAILIYHFPPQHAAEEAFFQNEAGTLPPGPVPVRAWLAGSSRLAFRLPDGVETLAVTLETLLDWRALVPVLPPNALPPDATIGPQPAAPGFGQTALELPTGLILSPDDSGGWIHNVAPHERDGRYALWHTRLGRRDSDKDGKPIVVDSADRFVRVVWNAKPPFPGDFINSLTPQERKEIEQLSANYNIPEPPAWARGSFQSFLLWLQLLMGSGLPTRYRPRPTQARRLMLSSLGAWTHLESAWNYPTIIPGSKQAGMGYETLSQEQWTHVMAQGRDQYVRTVQKAFVCDPGHRVSIVKITEREFNPPTQIGTEQTPGGQGGIFSSVAYLRQREQIVVQQALQDYTEQEWAFANQGLELPFRRLRITTRVTPFIDPRPYDDDPFWPTVGGVPFNFAMVGEDWDGQTKPTERPLMVVPLRATYEREPNPRPPGAPPIPEGYKPKVWTWPQILAEYHQSAYAARRIVAFGNQSVAYAANKPDEPGKTHLETQTITFEAQPVSGDKADKLAARGAPPFLPMMKSAVVNVPAINRILGRAEPVTIEYDPTYKANGIDGPGNPGEVFIKLLSSPKLTVAADKAGGVVRPESGVEGLSRNVGPVDKLDKFKSGTLDASAFSSFLLLGTIEISKILGPLGLDMGQLREAQGDPGVVIGKLKDPGFFVPAPVLVSWPVYAPGADPTQAAPVAHVTRLVWKPPIKTSNLVGEFLKFVRHENGQLYLMATLTTPLDGAPPAYTIEGVMQGFALRFFETVQVNIGRLSFKAVDGQKPDVSAERVDLEFLGALEFVNTLRDIIPEDGFSDPPYVTVDGAGILAGYTLAVPSLGIGIFSLQNLSLSAQLSLPFVGKPASVRFAVSERHKPFLVSVTLFGGGGFFAMTVGASGIEQIEAAIEFGGNISLNLGIASGGVYVMAGIYYSVTGNETKLTGYLRCGGYLEVLGLISISLEFYLGFTYRSKDGGGGEVWGQASLKVTIEIAFFSTSVTLTVERRFAGAAGDPTFQDVMPLSPGTGEPDDWYAYCAAFA